MDGAPTTSGSGGGGGGGPAPFLMKTYDMVDDSTTDEIVSWSQNKTSFVVWNPPEFARVLFPAFFKHNNFSSFICQLNTYVNASVTEIKMKCEGGKYFEVKKCGIHVIVDDPNAMDEDMDSDTMKSGRDDNEAGPSNNWSSDDQNCPKR